MRVVSISNNILLQVMGASGFVFLHDGSNIPWRAQERGSAPECTGDIVIGNVQIGRRVGRSRPFAGVVQGGHDRSGTWWW